MAKGKSSNREDIIERILEHQGQRTMERKIQMQKNWIIHTLLAGMENDTATLKSSLSVSYKKLRMQLPKDQKLYFWTFIPEK